MGFVVNLALVMAIVTAYSCLAVLSLIGIAVLIAGDRT